MLLMALFVALWTSVEALASNVLRAYSPYQVVWTRYAVHLLFMLLVWGWRDPQSLWRTRRPMYQISRAQLMLAMPASWAMAREAGVHGDEIMAVFWLAPLMILGLVRKPAAERAGRIDWGIAIVAYGAVLLVLEPRRWPGPAPMLLPIVMGFTFAAYTVMTRSLRSDSVRANLFYTALGVFVPLSLAMPAVWVAPTPRDLLVMVLVGLLGWVTLYVLDRAAAAGPLCRSAPITFLQLPLTVGLSWLSTGFRPDLREAIGGGVILLLLAWAWLRWRPMSGEALSERAT
jgi:drug/metabolite transporter (DMT)-like permease